MPINNYNDSDFTNLLSEHASLKTQLTVTQSVIMNIQKDQDKMESKFDRDLEGLRFQIKELNVKLDMLIDLANQAKGAGKASKVIWVLATVVISGITWIFTDAIGIWFHH